MTKIRAGDLADFANPEVDPASVWVRITPRWMEPLWREPFVAITVPWAIYLRHGTEKFEGDSLRRILTHELVHVRQWRQLGVAGFLRSYVSDYWNGRKAGLNHLDAYAAISLERDARRTGS